MPFLYEKIDTLREVGVSKELPKYIPENLNPNFELRPYQNNAFENFITYFESDKLCQKPTQTLFHMATGSGKTLIMAGLILYLYKHGYRNFLFFVNLSTVQVNIFFRKKLSLTVKKCRLRRLQIFSAAIIML